MRKELTKKEKLLRRLKEWRLFLQNSDIIVRKKTKKRKMLARKKVKKEIMLNRRRMA